MGKQSNSRWAAALTVWSVWLAMVGADFALVWKYGSNLPFNDDVEMIPAICGEVTDYAAWLWKPCAEHRVAVPRLIQLALYKISNNDFRSGMYFNVAALSAIAAAMIWAARRIRGHVSFTDIFFPPALLHWGQWENLLWTWQVQFVSSTLLAGLLLVSMVGVAYPFSIGVSITVGVCVMLLPLCGANGVALVPPLAAWLVFAGIGQLIKFPRKSHKLGGAILVLSALAALALVRLYFVDFKKTDSEAVDTWRAIQTSGRFLTMSLGPAASRYWPYTCFVLLALTLFAVLTLAWATVRLPSERVRAFGLLMFIAGVCALAVGLGWGRANLDENYGFVSRYVTLAAPLLAAIYFAFLLYLPGRLRVGMQFVLLLLVVLFAWPNAQDGLNSARNHRKERARFERDMRKGDNLSLLAQTHTNALSIQDWEQLNGFLRSLHEARVGVFEAMRADPPVRELQLPVTPTRVRNLKWEAGVATALNDDPIIIFELEKPQFVHAIRLKYSYPNEKGGARGEFYWCDSARNEFTDKERYLTWTATPGERVRTFWINDKIGHFRFDPDNKPGKFTLEEVTLLLPVDDSR